MKMKLYYQLRKNLISTLLLLAHLTIYNFAFCQEVDSALIAPTITNNINEIKLDLNRELKDQLIPLDSLIEIAIKNSPNVKSQEAIIRQGEEEVKVGKKEWQNGVFLSGVQSIGNSTQFFNSNNEPVGTQSQSKNTGYRIALNVNIPLYLFSARNNSMLKHHKSLAGFLDPRLY